MRIIAGALRGRTIKALKGTRTRPTSDRVREALFSRIESLAPGSLTGSVVLDAFAGSGALGLEAMSRGANRAIFVERDRGAVAVLRDNIETLGLGDACTVVHADAFRIPRSGGLRGAPFSLLFLDPPYRIDKSEVRALIEALAAVGALDDGTLVVWEHGTDQCSEWPQWFEPFGPKVYGTTVVDMATYRGGELDR